MYEDDCICRVELLALILAVETMKGEFIMRTMKINENNRNEKSKIYLSWAFGKRVSLVHLPLCRK